LIKSFTTINADINEKINPVIKYIKFSFIRKILSKPVLYKSNNPAEIIVGTDNKKEYKTASSLLYFKRSIPKITAPARDTPGIIDKD
jgi:hypothetical protein